jgi:hypothetical protein
VISFALRVNNSANSDNLATGDILVWGANGVSPYGVGLNAASFGVTGQCPPSLECTSFSDPDLVRQSLFLRNWTLRPDQYFCQSPILTGTNQPLDAGAFIDPELCRRNQYRRQHTGGRKRRFDATCHADVGQWHWRDTDHFVATAYYRAD